MITIILSSILLSVILKQRFWTPQQFAFEPSAGCTVLLEKAQRMLLMWHG
jgi:hypothetical protein